MSKEEFLKVQTCSLKVNIHCEGCKNKVKKILRKIDGVYIIKFEAEIGKVTVSGDVEPETLIRKLNKHGKHAELIGNSKENNGNHNQIKDAQVENGKVVKKKKGQGQKGNNTNQPPPQPRGGNLPPAMLNPQQMKALQDLMTKLPPPLNVPVNADGAKVPTQNPIPNMMSMKDAATGNVGPMGGMPMGPRGAQVGQMPILPMGQIPAALGHPATAVHVGGASGGAAVHADPEAPIRKPYHQQQMSAMMKNQQPTPANANDRFQPMVYARPPSAVNYSSHPNPPPPLPPPHDDYLNDENTISCSVM